METLLSNYSPFMTYYLNSFIWGQLLEYLNYSNYLSRHCWESIKRHIQIIFWNPDNVWIRICFIFRKQILSVFVFHSKLLFAPTLPLVVFLVSGGMSKGARTFPLKIFDTKISFNSTSGECIIVRMQSWPSYSLPQVTVYKSYQFRFKQSTCWSLPQQHQRRILPRSFY